MRKILTLLLCLIGVNQLHAQEDYSEHEIKGFVFERDARGDLQPLPGAHIFCIKDQQGSVSDASGAFVLNLHHEYPHPIIASFVGYESDTINLKKPRNIQFVLEATTLNEVELVDRKKSTSKSLLQTCNVEWVSGAELQKAACCNLSESFETNPSVDVSFTDAITGAKQIQMLGLDGVYTQILSENMPLLRGLSASYGLNYLPGSWIESIQIAKGTGSVVNGFESLSGQINVELFKPRTADKLFWNTYVNSSGMIENNFIVSSPVQGDWHTAILGHYSYLGKSVDSNNDNFADDPKAKRLTMLNRWEYTGFDNRHIAFGFRYLTEDKLSGQLNTDISGTEEVEFTKPYEVDMHTEQAEFHSKTGFIFDKPGTSLGLISSLRYHNQETSFGNSFYSGTQHSLYLNSIYQSNFGDNSKSYKIGMSYYGDNYQEKLQLGDAPKGIYTRYDQTLGAFGEFQFKKGLRFSSILGMRADYSKQWGMWYSPRLHLRYNPIENMVIRASAGRAHRQANVLAENISYFFSSRDLILNDYMSLEAEKAWNYGFNFTYNFYVLGKESTFNVDFYQTDFENQVVIDVEQGDQINIYNLSGESYSTSLQLDATIEPAEGWEVKFAQKWNETKTTYVNDVTSTFIPFVAKYRSLVQFSYTTWQNKWDINTTLQNIGPSRVPTQGEVEEFWSPNFNLLSGQVTRRFKTFDWYLGVENALNYTQDEPIRSVENPFSEDFDAAMIWGPVMGRRIYSGIRVRFND
jgi:outer membrane receptor protein involved in Fe transport